MRSFVAELRDGSRSGRVADLIAVLAAAWLLLMRRCPPAAALAGFLVFRLKRLGVELFSLARGYGLAVELSLCRIYLLVRTDERGLRPLPATVGPSLLVLAALAQLTLLDVWAGASAAFLLVGFLRHRRREEAPGRRLLARGPAAEEHPIARDERYRIATMGTEA